MGGKQTKEYFRKYNQRKETLEKRRIWKEKYTPKMSYIYCMILFWGW